MATADEVLSRARAVERGDAPSGSVVFKLTGERSLTTPGEEPQPARPVQLGLGVPLPDGQGTMTLDC